MSDVQEEISYDKHAVVEAVFKALEGVPLVEVINISAGQFFSSLAQLKLSKKNTKAIVDKAFENMWEQYNSEREHESHS